MGSLAQGGNPYLDQMYDRAADQVQARMGSSVAGMGMTNSGVQEQYGRSLNDLATQMYGGAYEQGQNRRMQAALAMPSYLSGATQYGLGIGDVYRD